MGIEDINTDISWNYIETKLIQKKMRLASKDEIWMKIWMEEEVKRSMIKIEEG